MSDPETDADELFDALRARLESGEETLESLLAELTDDGADEEPVGDPRVALSRTLRREMRETGHGPAKTATEIRERAAASDRSPVEQLRADYGAPGAPDHRDEAGGDDD
ncbi:hypothetical protein [Halobaculum gomorrense]|uniref:Uncharacterized protein n=1 Tax=Halobaculum gomorrense TaxID=43928 RepID=A0A1M5MDS3_9EURY|nr:hypothetical protein [Halobaculum gomorrense]SHG75302.1 hypothetical protein SAMN05443636_0975 [Halobaculum gomorrense]